MSRALLAVAFLLFPISSSAQLDEDSGSVPKVGSKVKIVDFSNEPVELAVPNIPASEYKDIPSQSQLGKLRFDDGTERQLTPEDLRWMALMVHAEAASRPTGSDGRWMIWSIAQRIYWRGRNESFETLVPLYSQPINTSWTLTGANCKDHPDKGKEEKVELVDGKKKRIYNPCAKHRLEKRDKYLTLKWDELSPMARMYAVLFATARLDNPHPGIIGWLAPNVWSPGGGEGKKKVSDFDDNVYYVSTKKRKIGGKERSTDTWTGAEVLVIAPDGKSSGIAKNL